MQQIAYPFSIDGRGRAAGATYPKHIRQMIEQVLFTNPGERVNRPDFGCGILQLVFAQNSDELATATQFLIQGSLDQWLGDLIQINGLEVVSQDSRLEVVVRYTIRQTQQTQTEIFSREV